MEHRKVRFTQPDKNPEAHPSHKHPKRRATDPVRGDLLTISKHKSPDYYANLIRHHLRYNSDNITLQALGNSSTHLVGVACEVTLMGYATYKKIKNDHLTVPILNGRGK